ncbi:MAG: hypothetical protein ABW152_05200 [Candidatus Thiodiazotropha endolucinida]
MATGKRGPSYPFINLESALQRAKQFKEKEGFNSARIVIAVSHWGYGAKSSGGLQTIAALKNYGLMSDSGTGKERKVQLTSLARRILLDTRTESPKRDKAIQEAALNPKQFLELWSKCLEGGMPSDENMEHDLVFDRNFNENTAMDVVRLFKETIEFAKLDISDGLSHNNEESFVSDKDVEREIQSIGDTIIKPQATNQAPQAAGKQIGSSIPVTNVCSMSVFAEGPVTQSGVSKLIAYLDLIKDSFPSGNNISEEKETN